MRQAVNLIYAGSNPVDHLRRYDGTGRHTGLSLFYFIFDLMDKARRHELKMLHYKKRMKKMRHVYPDGNYFAYRSHSTPCSCGCCRGDRYSRAKEMEEARKLAEPISEHGSL
jgi:hypothetical protein